MKKFSDMKDLNQYKVLFHYYNIYQSESFCQKDIYLLFCLQGGKKKIR